MTKGISDKVKIPAFFADEGAKGSITGSTLKIIAIITMLIDHIAAVVLDGYLQSVGYDFSKQINIVGEIQRAPFYGIIILFDFIMRLIGRLSFPLFCFLLSEGYIHTSSRFRYALRLFLFALLSELPFDLALGYEKGIIGIESQNIFFTLFIGLLTIWGMERFKKQIPVMLLIACTGILGAEFLRTDYGAVGVLLILIIHFLRKKSGAFALFVGNIIHTCFNLNEITSIPVFLFVKKYNGQRGLKLKYAFYLFYPVHLFILYLIKRAVIS